MTRSECIEMVRDILGDSLEAALEDLDPRDVAALRVELERWAAEQLREIEQRMAAMERSLMH